MWWDQIVSGLTTR